MAMVTKIILRGGKEIAIGIAIACGVVLFTMMLLWGLWGILATWWLDKEGYRVIVIVTSLFWVGLGGIICLIKATASK